MHGLAAIAAAVESATPLAELPSKEECRALRVSAGLSLQDAGTLSGLGHGSISRYERGVSRPRPHASLRYRKFLAVMRFLVAGQI